MGQQPPPAAGPCQPSDGPTLPRRPRRRSPVSAAPCRPAAAAVGQPLGTVGGPLDGRGRVPGRGPRSPQGWVPRARAAGRQPSEAPSGRALGFPEGNVAVLKQPVGAVLRWSGFGRHPESPWRRKCEGALAFTSASTHPLLLLG